MRFASLGRARVASRQAQPPWNEDGAAAWRNLTDELKEKQAVLGELRLMLKQPALNAGPRTNILFETGIRSADIQSAAGWLACDALADLRERRQDEALTNLQSLASLANLYREDYTLYSAMSRVVVAQAGLDLTWEALQSMDWDNNQLLVLQRAWQSVDLLQGLERGFIGERLFGFESLKRWMGEGKAESASASFSEWSINELSGIFVKRVWLDTVAPNDLRFATHYWQGKIDLVRDLKANRPLRQLLAPWQKLDDELYKRSRPPLRFLFPVSLVSIPNPKRALFQTLHVETERRLAMTAIALSRYQHARGRPPASLDVLVPEFLPSPALDCMSGHPLCYQANGDRTFTLYSVGNDGTDNGGDSSPTVSGGKLGLWEGRDAVWPLPLP
jgi:hypothetical protein